MAIRVTTEDLRTMAKNLRNHAKAAENMAASIKKTINTGISAWEGNAKNEYEADYLSIEPTLSKDLPEVLLSMAKKAEQKADDFDRANNVKR